MKTEEKLNMTMLCDFYELTMGNGYFQSGYKDRITYFDVFFRKVPDGGGFAIAAGLEQLIDYIENLHFTEEDIAYLRGRNLFCEEFLDYLKNFRFTGDIYAIPEGTPVFPKEPLVIVRAPAIEAQLIETFTLLTINHQSLVATKANRIVRAARGRTVLEFGSRRAQGADAAIVGARAAYIGGVAGTACTISDEIYGVPAGGTMAHAWVQMFDSEYEAFRTYCELYPTNATLLVDTYNTLHSGIPNAIRAFNEVLKPKGITKCGIRLDSGDLAYLTRKARKMLDEAGWTDCKISVSNSLDEYLIQDMLLQGAQIDLFGVGERMITAKSEPVFGGVYKLVAVEDADGDRRPEDQGQRECGEDHHPALQEGFPPLWPRHRQGHRRLSDVCTTRRWTTPTDLDHLRPRWRRGSARTSTTSSARELLVPVFPRRQAGLRQPFPRRDSRPTARQQVDTLWDEVKRFDNPHKLPMWTCPTEAVGHPAGSAAKQPISVFCAGLPVRRPRAVSQHL